MNKNVNPSGWLSAEPPADRLILTLIQGDPQNWGAVPRAPPQAIGTNAVGEGLQMPESPEIVAIQKKITELKEELSRLRRLREPEAVRDYELTTAQGERATLTTLFDGHRDMLVIHNMGKRCPYCTLWADGLNGLTDHLSDRAAFILTTPDEPRAALEFAQSRGWRFPVVSHARTSFAKDLGFEPRPGAYMPGVSALRLKENGAIERSGSDFFGPGDDYCALWRLFDLLAEGANEWSPKYGYDISPIKVNF